MDTLGNNGFLKVNNIKDVFFAILEIIYVSGHPIAVFLGKTKIYILRNTLNLKQSCIRHYCL